MEPRSQQAQREPSSLRRRLGQKPSSGLGFPGSGEASDDNGPSGAFASAPDSALHLTAEGSSIPPARSMARAYVFLTGFLPGGGCK